jgi:hypothetical protein
VFHNSFGVTPYRRERNRASALEAYYRGKARRTELESQLLELKEEDAALRALAAMTELDTGAAGDSAPCQSLLRLGPAQGPHCSSCAGPVHHQFATALGAQAVCCKELDQAEVLHVTVVLPDLQCGFGRC